MTNRDWIRIDQLSVVCRIGVHEWEQKTPRQLKISLRLGWDIEAAGKQDNLDLSLDYAAIATLVREIAALKSYRLLETLATELADALLSQWPIPELTVLIDKPDAIPGAKAVGIEIHRRRNNQGMSD